MDWYIQATEQLAAATAWTYRPSGKSYAEPAALTSLCLLGLGKVQEATVSAEWLTSIQNTDGSVGVSESEMAPCWPTGLAISVWANWQHVTKKPRFATNIKSALDWALSHQGKTLPQYEALGHDTSLRGWSWAHNTHAWLEPTAMFVMGLLHSGQSNHPRTIEAVRLIVDRQLPQGGFNYGNTTVLGQQLLPRVQPTGVALAALAASNIDRNRIQRSVRYLQQQWPKVNSTASLCYAAIGLSAFGLTPESLDAKLRERFEIWCRRKGSTHKLALLALAAQKERCLFGGKIDQNETNNSK